MDDTAQRRRLSLIHRPDRVINRVLRVLSPLVDGVALLGAFALGYWARLHFPIVPGDDPVTQAGSGFVGLLPTLILHLVTLMLTFFFARLYHQERASSRIDLYVRIFAAISVGVTLTSGLATFLLKNSIFDADYPRQLVLYVWFFSTLSVILGREFIRQITNGMRLAGVGRDRVIIVGTGQAAYTIIEQIQSRRELGYEIIGAVNGSNVRDVAGVPVIGHPDDLPQLIDSLDVAEVIIALPDAPNQELTRLVSMCQRGRTSIKLYPDLFAFMTGGMTIGDLGGMPLLSVRDMPLRGWNLSLKRGLDILGAIFGLTLLSPLMLLTAILVRLESPGPVWFCQERAGLDGRPFPMIKFRTMRADAEKGGPGWTVANDPRVTRMGRWMRRSNWDEIPQLINVLLGQMSLVGPRPEQPYYVEQFRSQIPRYMERHREKAGMTGWAQVNGYRGDTSIEERTKFDLYYVENWSIWFDIKIIIRTVMQTLLRRSKNAY
jgi:exopolysaccharide biosynthesis polyprenyl glycosylphosphotransferase